MTDPKAAVLMPLDDLLLPDDVGQKLRIVGFLIAFDTAVSIGVVAYGGTSLLVNFSLCLNEADRPRLKSLLMLIGELEPADVHPQGSVELYSATPEAIPPIPAPSRSAVLNAILMKEVDDMDMRAWEQSARLQSKHLMDRHNARMVSKG
ncbi:hypothetical protein IE81DRAFT_348602 [Ceraceosorus guamensis]|uniref:Uncharacterized protein n=1 Tax=Ceraceosorus guamensis TaxID=1522189 RepID=A0A316VU56_9BASI|nr:hypothetical protein IE81DRAFT_348602 [Ceraceosorus guamensis]PWN41156.1 hypothetical protein IE81DRAFT_348602 [Ceraceosorus guamensis]